MPEKGEKKGVLRGEMVVTKRQTARGSPAAVPKGFGLHPLQILCLQKCLKKGYKTGVSEEEIIIAERKAKKQYSRDLDHTYM